MSRNALNQRFIEAVNWVLTTQKEYNKSKIAKEMGITPQILTEILGGRMNASLELAAALTETFNISSEWMLLGNGPIDNAQMITDLMDEGKKEIAKIPYYNIDFCASFELVENTLQAAPDDFINDPLFEGSEYVVRCFGDSMGDKIPNGCYLGVRETELSDVLYGEIYAIVTTAYRTVKYLRKSKLPDHILLVPENLESYDAQDVPVSKIKSVWAVVAFGLKIN